MELQPQTSIKKEKEKALSSKRNTIIKKEGQKKHIKKESKPHFATHDSNQVPIRSPTNALEVLLKLQYLSLNLLYLYLFIPAHRLQKKVT